jgi:hypothetical protein
MPSNPPSFWLTRFLILRLLGAVYAIAFLAAINQLLPLIGSQGLTPADTFIRRISDAIGATSGFIRLPSLFWINHSDATLLTTAWIGLALSLLVTAGFANAIIMAILWFLYMSIVNVGQEWYGYGWEIQLLETGFLAIFLCPLLEMRPFPKSPPPIQLIILFQWLICRIMLGAGLIKLRGDEIWRNATALYYHFETQPLPGPLSRWFHFLPHPVLQAGVYFNWLAELVAPFFVFWPRLARHIAGPIIIALQIVLVLSGNLSFLNWLTIIPALACLDDSFWQRLLPQALKKKAANAEANAKAANATTTNPSTPTRPATITTWTITIIIGLLSIQPVFNMLSPNQIMNTSYDPLNLVNTYGAFGSVGKERLNIIFEGSTDSVTWKEYPYKALPVALDKRPPQIAPYQPHFDWQMWFAAMSTPDEYPWTTTLIKKLLKNDPLTLSLFGENPFKTTPPKYIRAILYRYSFAKPGNPTHQYWTREQLAIWLPAMSIDQKK